METTTTNRFHRSHTGQLIRSEHHGWYLFNVRGDVVQRVDSNGNLLHTYLYDGFGNELGLDLNQSNNANNAGNQGNNTGTNNTNNAGNQGNGNNGNQSTTNANNNTNNTDNTNNQDKNTGTSNINNTNNQGNGNNGNQSTTNADNNTNNQGNTSQSNNATTNQQNTNPFRFAGEYWDWATGTYYLRARHFNPTTGRFTQPDPHWTIHNGNMIFGDNPQARNNSLMLNAWAVMQAGNLFVYCMNNPVMFVDPTGLAAFTTTRNARIYSYTLFVDRFDPGFSTFSALMPASSISMLIANAAQGNRRIDVSGWQLAGLAGTAVDIATSIGNPLNLISPIGVSTAIAFAEMMYLNSTKSHILGEAVFNQFQRSVWHSQSREAVEGRYRFAMEIMGHFVASGGLRIERAGDVFASNQFFNHGSIGMLTWQFDPLTGGSRHFHQDRFYFFATCDSIHGLISRIESLLRQPDLGMGW